MSAFPQASHPPSFECFSRGSSSDCSAWPTPRADESGVAGKRDRGETPAGGNWLIIQVRSLCGEPATAVQFRGWRLSSMWRPRSLASITRLGPSPRWWRGASGPGGGGTSPIGLRDRHEPCRHRGTWPRNLPRSPSRPGSCEGSTRSAFRAGCRRDRRGLCPATRHAERSCWGRAPPCDGVVPQVRFSSHVELPAPCERQQVRPHQTREHQARPSRTDSRHTSRAERRPRCELKESIRRPDSAKCGVRFPASTATILRGWSRTTFSFRTRRCRENPHSGRAAR